MQRRQVKGDSTDDEGVLSLPVFRNRAPTPLKSGQR